MVKAKKPKVNAAAKRLVELADEFRRRKVWSGIPDSAVVLMRIEADSEPWVVAILGNGGIDEGLSVCRGAHGYRSFVDLQESLGQDESVFDPIDVLILGYSPKREIPTEFCRVLTQAGIRGDGNRLVPWLIAQDAYSRGRPFRQSDVRILTEVLRGLLACHRAGTIEPILSGSEQSEILEICVSKRGAEAKRVPLPPECLARESGSQSQVSSLLRNLPELDTDYLVVRVRMSGAIDDDGRLMSAVSVLDVGSDRIIGQGIAMGDAKDDVADILSETLQGRMSDGQRGRPRRFLFGENRLFESLQSTLAEIGIPASYEPDNPRHQAFRNHMSEFLRRATTEGIIDP